MTAIVWDQVGDRRYEGGVSHGVLYAPGRPGVAWNGLTSVEEAFDRQNEPYYLDGAKYLEVQTQGDYAATLKAFTYPAEFEEVLGVRSLSPGIVLHDQKSKVFGLSYRTRLGDDVEGFDRGYRIHLLYNLRAIPDSATYGTLSNQAKPVEFSWRLSSVPTHIPGFRPTAHASLDTRAVDPELLSSLEATLYGTAESAPSLVPLEYLTGFTEA